MADSASSPVLKRSPLARLFLAPHWRERALRIVGIVLAVLVVLGTILAGFVTWNAKQRDAFARLTLDSRVLAVAAAVRFTEYRAELNIMALNIQDERALSHPLRVRMLMRNALKAIPQATAIVLFDGNGHVVTTVGDTSVLPRWPASFMTAPPPPRGGERGFKGGSRSAV